ncbi:MAG: hypothetical protein IT537_20510 [Hyphomicrobiales bacterium]|nr:hypothetical protein [Hyphomicrobiales bacterium]
MSIHGADESIERPSAGMRVSAQEWDNGVIGIEQCQKCASTSGARPRARRAGKGG